MNEPVFFSIVVPTYNRAHLISPTIESILAQTYRAFELIIVDDGSTDDTEAVMQKYLSDQVRYYKKENGERAAARNYGTKQAKGEYVNWFDSDDIMHEDNLLRAAELIKKHNHPEVIAQSFDYIALDGTMIMARVFPTNVNETMYDGNMLANSPVMVRRDIALANPLNEDRDLSGSEDFELWLRLAARYHIYTSPLISISLIAHDERSVLVMNKPDQLIARYTKFLKYAGADSKVLSLLGSNKNYFYMKNYLQLAVELINHNHQTPAKKYLKMAMSSSPKIFLEKGFYAFFKHYLRHLLS